VEDRLRKALKQAMKTLDPIAKSAISSVLGSIDIAGSVGLSGPNRPTTSGHIAGSVSGLGAGDVPPTGMDDGHLIEIVRAEVAIREGPPGSTKSWAECHEPAMPRSECEVLRGIFPNELPG
jgi:hypothetical protein